MDLPSVTYSDDQADHMLTNFVYGNEIPVQENDENNSYHEIPVQENNEENSNQNQVENFVHKCGTCAKNFKLHHQLMRHIAAVHEEKKPFNCPTCNKNFSQKSNLKQHISAVHKGKKDYKCNTCNRSFTKRHMKAHKASHERELSAQQPSKNNHLENSLNCSFCHTVFSSKRSLMFHIKKYVLTCIAELC